MSGTISSDVIGYTKAGGCLLPEPGDVIIHEPGDVFNIITCFMHDI